MTDRNNRDEVRRLEEYCRELLTYTDDLKATMRYLVYTLGFCPICLIRGGEHTELCDLTYLMRQDIRVRQLKAALKDKDDDPQGQVK